MEKIMKLFIIVEQMKGVMKKVIVINIIIASLVLLISCNGFDNIKNIENAKLVDSLNHLTKKTNNDEERYIDSMNNEGYTFGINPPELFNDLDRKYDIFLDLENIRINNKKTKDSIGEVAFLLARNAYHRLMTEKMKVFIESIVVNFGYRKFDKKENEINFFPIYVFPKDTFNRSF